MKTKSVPSQRKQHRGGLKSRLARLAQPLEFASLVFPPGRTILSVPEIAQRLGVTRTHLYALIEDGTLQAINAGGTGRSYWRVPVEAFNDFVRRNHSYAVVCDNRPSARDR